MAALAIIAIGALAFALASSDDEGEKATIRQKVLNSIDITAIANVLVKNAAISGTSQFIDQQVNLILKECKGGSVFNITQDGNIKMNLYNVAESKISQDLVQDFKTKLENQLKSAIEQVDKKLIPIFEKKMTSDQQTDIKNIIKQTIETNVTSETISKTINDSIIKQGIDLTLDCGGATLPDSFNLSQNAQIELMVINTVNSVIDQAVKQITDADIINKADADAKQTQTDFLSEIVDMIGKFWYVIVAIIALILIVGLFAFIFLMSGDGGEERRQQVVRYMIPQRRY